MPKISELTPVEYELMEILWHMGGGTVTQVKSHLPKDRDLAYTSVSTILRILQQKKVLRAVKIGRSHTYQPIIKKENYAHFSINKMLNHVFEGKSIDLLSHLVNQENISLVDIEAMLALLDTKKKELKK